MPKIHHHDTNIARCGSGGGGGGSSGSSGCGGGVVTGVWLQV